MARPETPFQPFFGYDAKRIAEVFSKIVFPSHDDMIKDPHNPGQVDQALHSHYS